MHTQIVCATHLGGITLSLGLIAGGQRLPTGTLQRLQREAEVESFARVLISSRF